MKRVAKMQTLTKNTQKNQIKEILKTYNDWSAYSKSHNHEAMLNLSLPNSGFSEITNICRKSREIGINCYYEFNSVKVIKITNNPSYAIVHGEISLIMSKHRFISTGTFRSSCVLVSEGAGLPHSADHCLAHLPSRSGLTNMAETWKLSEIEIEWEF